MRPATIETEKLAAGRQAYGFDEIEARDTVGQQSIDSKGNQKTFSSSEIIGYRRKFRSQTSNNMDRWSSRGGKSQRREDHV